MFISHLQQAKTEPPLHYYSGQHCIVFYLRLQGRREKRSENIMQLDDEGLQNIQ